MNTLPAHDHTKRRLVHITTTDMSLDWLLGPQLQAFAAAGYEVIGMSSAGEHVDALADLGIPHVDVPAFTRSNNPLQDLRAFWQVFRLLRQLRPDIVHTHNPKPGIIGRIAARVARVPLIVNTQHGLYAQPTDRRMRRWAVYTAERVASMFGHVELVQNVEDVRTLVDVLHVPARKVHLLGNGIDLARFSPTAVTAETRRRVRHEWGIGDGEIVCGVVGRLVREKGIVELLDAAHQLRKHGIAARFVIVGPADTEKADSIDRATVDRAVSDGVVFAGQRTDMPECYAAMDVFVTASWREGVPRAAMEAAAMGLPTVATDIRGNRQVVEHLNTGLLVEVRNSAALSGAIEALVIEPERRLSMATAARDVAIERFDQASVIRITLAQYAGHA